MHSHNSHITHVEQPITIYITEPQNKPDVSLLWQTQWAIIHKLTKHKVL